MSVVQRPSAAPTVVVHEVQGQDGLSTKAVIGTLLGAAAGAAVAYAMVKGEEQSSQPANRPQSQAPAFSSPARSVPVSNGPGPGTVVATAAKTIFQALENVHLSSPPTMQAPGSQYAQSTPRTVVRAIEAPPTVAPLGSRSTLIHTFVPPSEIPRVAPMPLRTQVLTSMHEHATARSETHVSTSTAKKSRAGSKAPTTVVRAKSAYEVPVARSMVGSVLGLSGSKAGPARVSEDKDTVVPEDSISQVGSSSSRHRRKKDKDSRAGSRHSTSSRRDKEGEGRSRTGSRTGSRVGSVASSRRRHKEDDVVKGEVEEV